MTCRPHPPSPSTGRCDLIRACPPPGVAHPSPVHQPTRSLTYEIHSALRCTGPSVRALGAKLGAIRGGRLWTANRFVPDGMDRCGLLWTTCVHLRIRRLGIRVPPGVPASPARKGLRRVTTVGPSDAWEPFSPSWGPATRRSFHNRAPLAACMPSRERRRPEGRLLVVVCADRATACQARACRSSDQCRGRW